MRFVLISDTHIGGRFDELMFNKGVKIANSIDSDYLIHLGDLTDGGTKAEYEIASLYLEEIKKSPFFIIPGNHDAKNVGDLLWEEYIGPRFFVHTNETHKVKILALDSTEPDSNPGRMGPKGVNRIYEEFNDLPDYWLKILMFHHQTLPIPYTGRERSAIKDAGNAVKAILDCNVHLVFNGHRHISNVFSLSDGVIDAWIINCGTLSCKKTRYKEEYSMTVVDIDRKQNTLAVRVIMLNHDPPIEQVNYSSKFQHMLLGFKSKKLLRRIIQLGNTAFSSSHFDPQSFNKGVEKINNCDCDLVIHTGDVTAHSYISEYNQAHEELKSFTKPLVIVPGDNDYLPLGDQLFPKYIGHPNPFYEDSHASVAGYNTCLIDEHVGRLGRGNTADFIEKLTSNGNNKLGVLVFHHTIIPLAGIKHDAELMDAGDVLDAIVKNRINLVLSGAKNRSGCWQVNDTVFVNVGSFSTKHWTELDGNGFNIIDIYQTDLGKSYEIYKYCLETDEKKLLGSFNISERMKPIKIPPKLEY